MEDLELELNQMSDVTQTTPSKSNYQPLQLELNAGLVIHVFNSQTKIFSPGDWETMEPWEQDNSSQEARQEKF